MLEEEIAGDLTQAGRSRALGLALVVLIPDSVTYRPCDFSEVICLTFLYALVFIEKQQ